MQPHDTPTTKRCTWCGEIKPLSEFHKRTASKDGLHSYCKPCNSSASKAWYRNNVDRVRERDRAYREANRDARRQHSREYYRKNLDEQKAQSARRYKEDKDAAFTAYGGYVCACCGETERAFLCLDHINNDGYEHRRKINKANIYQWLKKEGYPEGLMQVLCYNCNQGKRINGGVCPHQTELWEAQYGMPLREV